MKLKYFVFSLLMSFLALLNVNATLKLEGDTTITYGSPGTVYLVGSNLDSNLNKLSFTIAADSCISVSVNSNPMNLVQTTSGNSVVLSGEFHNGNLMSFTITSKANNNQDCALNIKDTTFNDELMVNEAPDTKTFKLKTQTTTARNTSAKLSAISNNANATLSPTFSPDTTSYTLTVKDTIQDITFSPRCAESGCSTEPTCISGCSIKDSTRPNKITLAIGKNELKYNVVSQDQKSAKDYTIVIYRGATTDGSNFLKNLEIEGFKLKEKFDKNTLDYTATVDYEHEKVIVNALGEDTNADIQIKGADKLLVGDNVITITVTSATTGEKKIYNITVTREDFKMNASTTTATLLTTSKKSHKKIWLIIIIVIAGLLIIGAAAYFIFFKKDGGKKKKITKDEELKKEKDHKTDELSIKDNNETDATITDHDEKPSIDEALADLMETKELTLTDINNLR